MLRRDRERRDRLRYQARKLANSGRFRNWEEIQASIERSGRKGAEKALGHSVVRFMLNLQCAFAKKQR